MGLWRAFRRSALAGLALSLVAALPRAAAAASANELFGEVDGPTAAREPEGIGSYSRGCLRGAVELPATGHRAGLGGDADLPQPELGSPEPDRLPRAPRGRDEAGRGSRHPARRHGAAARRTVALRPRLAPDRPRRRRL